MVKCHTGAKQLSDTGNGFVSGAANGDGCASLDLPDSYELVLGFT